MITIIRTINEHLKTDNNSNPIKQKWQTIELICGITHNVKSPAEIKHWIEAASKGLALLYNTIWKPRSNTANTAPSTGIKWKSKTPENANPPNKNTNRNKNKNQKKDNNNKSFLSNTSSINESSSVELTSLASKEYIKSDFSYKKCLSNLISLSYSNTQNSG